MSEPATIQEALFATAGRGEGEFVFHLEDGPQRLPAAELAGRALKGARRLLARGVEPGEAVGMLGPNRAEWVVGAFSAWIAGAALVPVPVPLRVRDPAAFAEQLRRLLTAAGCRCVLAAPAFHDLLPEGLALDWAESGDESAEALPAPDPDRPAVIQFTSGSTAAPKGALLDHATVKAQIDVLRHAYLYPDGTPRTALSWAPFFHDLGLFPNLVQVAFTGATIHQLPTDRFARDPGGWLRLVESTRAALTVAPSSAFGSALRAVSRRAEPVDLSSLDVAYVAAEGVDPEVSRRMLEAAQSLGLRSEALGVAYGLAEAGAVSMSRVGSGMRIDRVDLEQLTASRSAVPGGGLERPVSSCGPALMDLRIHGPGGVLSERQVGEIQVRGPSLMSGYIGADAPDPFVDGWLCTGDLGYLADGELYVTGREKDVMIVMGQNYYPEDFEWAAGRVDGVRPGRCLAFNPPGGGGAVVMVEARDGEPPARIERDVARAVADAVGVAPGEVLVLAPGTVEKTTSGKLRRAAMREAYARGEMTRLAA